MISKLTTLFPLSLCLLLCSLQVHASNALTEINVATVNITPRGFINQEGLMVGGSYEVVNKIIQEAGYSYQNKLLPFARIVKQLETGKSDVALLVPSSKLDNIAIPFAYIRDVHFIAIAQQTSQLDSESDIQNKRVGQLRNAGLPSKLISQFKGIKVQGNNYQQLIEMLLSNRIDLIIAPKVNIYWALKELNYEPSLLGKPLSLKKLEMHLVYSQRNANQQIMNKLAITAEKLHKNKEIEKILSKYDYSNY